MTIRSNMHPAFAEAALKSGDWLGFLGEPTLYDGALFVERDTPTLETECRVREALIRYYQ